MRRPRGCRHSRARSIRRTPSAWVSRAATASTTGSSTSLPSKYLTTAESTTGTAPAKTSPVVPSRETTSPSWMIGPPRTWTCRRTGSTTRASAPQTHGRPMPRATTAACEVLPPRLVRVPRAATMPWRSSGFVSSRTRIDVLAALTPRHGCLGVEHDPADCGAGGGADTDGEALATSPVVEAREHQAHQLRTGHSGERLVEIHESFTGHGVRDPERGLGRAFPHPRLEHPELAALDGELDVTHVPVVALQRGHVLEEFVVGRLVQLGEVTQRHRVADAGDDVLALCVLQVVAVHAAGTRGRVARERHPGTGGRTTVAEDHGLDVHRCAEVLGDVLALSVERSARRVPGVEDRPHGEVELFAGVLRESHAPRAAARAPDRRSPARAGRRRRGRHRRRANDCP